MKNLFFFFPFLILHFTNQITVPIHSYSQSVIPYYISENPSLSFLSKEPIPGVSLYLGNPPQKMEFGLTTRSSFSWVASSKIEDQLLFKGLYNEDKSTSYTAKNVSHIFEFQDKIFFGELSEDYINIKSNVNIGRKKDSKFLFLLFTKKNQFTKLENSTIDGEISFNPFISPKGDCRVSDKEYKDSSFINILKSSHQIKNKKIAMTYSNKGGMMYIDENLKFKNFCHFNSDNRLSCKLTFLDMGEGNSISLRENATFFFDMNNHFILAPKEDGRKILTIYRVLMGDCSINEKNGKMFLICDKENIEQLEKTMKYLQFTFDNKNSFKIPLRDLFSMNEKGEMIFKVIADNYESENNWKFGNVIFNSNVLEIDYDNKKIFFDDIESFNILNDNILDHSTRAISRLFVLTCVLLVMCLITISYLLSVRCFIKNKSNYIENYIFI